MESEREEELVVAIVGGGGFVGRVLGERLRRAGRTRIVSLDLSPPPPNPPPSPSPRQNSEEEEDFIAVDVRDLKQVQEALHRCQPHLVCHLAGWGMSGSPMLSLECHAVNAKGTKNVLEACRGTGAVKGLLYLSTYNVVFGGQEVLGGDETMPYFPQLEHSDQYAPSKTIAEKAVLEANGEDFKTCVIRPAAIYGPGEERHFPRIIEVIDSGLFLFRIGDAIVDWVHVENLVQAIELALLKLLKEHHESKREEVGESEVSGNAFFISDGTPIKNNDFLLPLCAARGVRAPMIYLPVSVGLLLAAVAESVFYISAYIWGKDKAIEPFLTTPEVLKVGVSHYFSINKAAKRLGYQPTCTSESGSREMAAYYRFVQNKHFTSLCSSFCVLYGGVLSRQHMDCKNYFQLVHPLVAVLIIIGMSLLTLVAFETSLVESWPESLQVLKEVAYFALRTQRNIQLVLYLALSIHAIESVVAFNMSKALGCRKKLVYCWAVQTLVFGVGSLSLLVSRRSLMISTKKKLE